MKRAQSEFRNRLVTVLAAAAFVLAAAPFAAAQQRVTAEWDANADPYTVGYRLYIGLAPGNYAMNLDAGAATSYHVDLPASGVYYFVVRAYNQSAQLGPPSNEASFSVGATGSVPGPPTGLNATVAGSLATLRWNAPSSGGQPSGYGLFVGTAPGQSNMLNGLVLGPGLAVAGNVPPGRYYARLVAFNGAGVGAASNEVSFVVAGGGSVPPGPPVLGTPQLGNGSVTLQWTAPSSDSGGGPATSYVIEAGTAPGLSNIGVFNVGSATTFATAIPPGVYYVRVRAVNAAGYSAPSAEREVRYGTTSAPRSLAQTGSGSTVTLTWRAPSSGTPTGYLIEVGNASGQTNLAVVPVGNVLRFTASVPSGRYFVRVRALNAAGASAASNQITFER